MARVDEWKVEVDATVLKRVVSALKKESDGKELARDLIRNLRVVAEPALAAARASILSMGSHSEALPGLRATVARQTKISVRSTGRRPGVSIRVQKTGMPRGFRGAPAALNSAKGWRHPVFQRVTAKGRYINVWVTQRGKPGWFDESIRPFKEPAKEAAARALDHAARRIAERSKV